MKYAVDLVNCETFDISMVPATISGVTYKHGAGQMFRIRASYTFSSDASDGSGTITKDIWTTPNQNYMLHGVAVELSSALTASGVGVIDLSPLEITIDSATLINAAGGTFSTGTYSITNGNKIWWDSRMDVQAQSGGAGNQAFMLGGGAFVGYGSSVKNVALKLKISSNPASWTLTGGTVRVHIFGSLTG